MKLAEAFLEVSIQDVDRKFPHKKLWGRFTRPL